MNVSTCERPKSRTQGLGMVTAKGAPLRLREYYQPPARVQPHVPAQDPLVPENALFGAIIRVLIHEIPVKKRSIRILEPGMDQAAFTRLVMRPPLTDRFDEIYVEGTDISQGMPTRATEVVDALYQSRVNGSRVTVALSSGANCINAADTFYWAIKSAKKRFDAVVATQLEHYCPNSPTSPLADRYRKRKVRFSTKTEFRHHCYELLDAGGFYFAVDDRLGESLEERKMICDGPDGHRVRQFMDDMSYERCESLNPAVARHLQLAHTHKQPASALANVIAGPRNHRRAVCCAEVEPLSVTRRDFVEIFGEENVYCSMHPSIETHPGFYLMWAVKRE